MWEDKLQPNLLKTQIHLNQNINAIKLSKVRQIRVPFEQTNCLILVMTQYIDEIGQDSN